MNRHNIYIQWQMHLYCIWMIEIDSFFLFIGILYGTMTLELGGRVTIHCEKTKCIAHLEFKLKV